MKFPGLLGKLRLNRTAALVAACVLAVGGAAGGTVAWLIGRSTTLVNTFTPAKMAVSVAETTTSYVMVPGAEIAKDPKVTLAASSEDAWLFVELEESANFKTFLSFAAADGWTQLKTDGTDVPGVYYREVAQSDTDQVFQVLKDDKVTVQHTVTLPMLNSIAEGITAAPTLSVTAYAVQKQGAASASEAWALAKQ